MRVVYVQAARDGELLNPNCFAAWYGFNELGYDVRRFTADEVPNLALDSRAIVHGNIGPVKAVLRRLKVPEPAYLNLPDAVQEFTGRAVWNSTLGEVRSLQKVPVFIKPLNESKVFTGHVVSQFRDLLETVALPDDYPVLAQDAVTFVSEWRVFVQRKSIIGIGHYRGDPLLFPARSIVEAVLEAYKDPIVAHSMDFGTTPSGQTLLVEMNDAYALGHYGLAPVKYVRMIEARWDEICGHPKWGG